MECTVSLHSPTRCRFLRKKALASSVASAAILFSLGCGQSTTARNHADAADAARAEEIANKMLAVYREARAYTDHAAYVQQSTRRSEGVERQLPFFHMALAFERPNRLRLSFEEAVESSAGRKGFDIASNGTIVRCAAGELPGQIHESAAPQQFTAKNFLPDPYLRQVFEGRTLGDVFPQLAMLLNQDDQSLVFPADEPPRMLPRESLRGRDCYRLASESPAGTRILWIDSKTYVLHRMELPIDAQRTSLDADNQYSQLAVWIDFEDATFDAEIDDSTFHRELGKDDRRVRRFVALPPPAPPESLGKPLPEFEFTTLEGKSVTPTTLAGKTVLFEFWQTDCAACREHTPELQAAYDELQDAEDFEFYAVNTDPPRLPNSLIENTLRGWGGEMPIVRDLQDMSFAKKIIDRTPTLALLDAEGRLQYLHVNLHEDPQGLVKLIHRVRSGANLAAEIRAEYGKHVEDYEQELESVTIKDSVVEVQVARAEPRERKLPEKFAVGELWEANPDDLRRPGNLLVLGGPGSGNGSRARILALDGGQAIVEFDAEGNSLARHELPNNAEPASGLLRTVVDGASRRWIAASGVGWQKVHLLDEAWKPVLTFPKERHPGIADVQLIRHDEEARLCVGFWGGVGVQGVGLDGKRKWANRTLDQVVQLTLVPGASNESPELWCTSNRGTIVVLDLQGTSVRELAVGLRSLMQLAVARVDGAIHCCGLSVEAVGDYDAVGFSPDGEVLWKHDLPPGEYAHQVERIQHVALPGGDSGWMIAAADGSILWLNHEGVLIDEFAYGHPLTGLSLTNSADAAILLVSTPEKLTAWKLTANE